MHKHATQRPQTREFRLFTILIVVSLIPVIPYWLGIGLSDTMVYLLFGLLVIATGIPHGSVDHLVAAQVFGLDKRWSDQIRFYGAYLLTMLVFGAVWIVSPQIGFIFFLLISVYHFGQGDLSWLAIPAIPAHILYISRGVMLLALPILGHLELTAPIIREASGLDVTAAIILTEYAQAIALASWITHAVLLVLITRSYTGKVAWQELLLVFILGIVLLETHPLVGFGIYFGIWHGLNHFFELRDHFAQVSPIAHSQTDPKSPLHHNTPSEKNGKLISSEGIFRSLIPLYKKTIPFTLVSLAGLVILWFLLDGFGVRDRMISVLFILISILTLPHMVIIHSLYAGKHTVENR